MNSFVLFFLLSSSFFLWCAMFSDVAVLFVQILLVLVICCVFVLYIGLFLSWDEIWMEFVFWG